MATLTLTSSSKLDGYGHEQPKLNSDQRASVNTWTSSSTTRYTPSVFTFNANWTPAPLAPLRFSSYTRSSGCSSAACMPMSPSTSAFGASRRWSRETYRQSGIGIGVQAAGRLRTGAAEGSDERDGCDDDDGERVSHLDFDSDSDSDGDDGEEINVEEEGEGEGEGLPNERRLEDRRHFDSDHCTNNENPTPTRAHIDFARPFHSERRSSHPQSDSNAALRAYLASYGFPDGLGYECPPFDNSPRSSPSSPSRYSSYGEDNPDPDGSYNTIRPGISEFASASPSNYHHRSRQDTQVRSFYPKSHVELPSLSPSAWSTSFEALSALLSSLELDSPLRDDPCGTWEALCWDEVAPEDDSDTASEGDYGEDHAEERGMQNDNRVSMSEDWASMPPSPHHPVFRRVDLTELGIEAGVENHDGIDSRMISHDIWTGNDNNNGDGDDENNNNNNNEAATEAGAGMSPSTSTRTSTITTGYSDEWIALTAARAQAARARILPYRQIHIPYPTSPQEDVPVLQDTARTPVDPVLVGTPPVPPVSADLGSGINIDNPEMMTAIGHDGEGMADVLAAADSVSVNVGETAPRYGECGRDQLVTIAERDPPPYDLAYESPSGYTSFSGLELEVMRGESAPPSGEAERAHFGSNDDGSVPAPQTSSPSSFPNVHPSLLAYAHTPRARSQLSFPTSPTESDTHANMTSPTLSSSSNGISPYSASPISPSETTLTTPGGTYFSTLFPSPVQQLPFTDPSQSAKAQLNSVQGDDVGVNRPQSPLCPFPSGGGVVSTPPSTAPARPRPLPPRPVGPIPRTTAEAWFISSAAGPYVDGRTNRDLPPPASASLHPAKFGSRSTLGYGYGPGSSEGQSHSHSHLGGGSSENIQYMGSSSGPGPGPGWRSSPAYVSNFERFGSHSSETLGGGGPNNGSGGFGLGTRASQETETMTVTRHGSDESGGSPATSLEYLRPDAQPFRHRTLTLVNTNSYSDGSHSTDSLSLTLPRRSEEKLKEILGLSSLSGLEDYKSASETAFHIIPPPLNRQQQRQQRKHGRNRRSSSGGSGGVVGGGAGVGGVNPLQRLATRYSTFTRRIGIATGAGSGKER